MLVALALIVALGFGLRLDAALNPSLDPGEDSIVAYQGNDSKAYGQIAEALYRDWPLRHAGDAPPEPTGRPVAPFLYAGVYCLTGGANEEIGAHAVALLGALMVLFVYLLGRRLGGPGGRAAGRARRPRSTRPL